MKSKLLLSLFGLTLTFQIVAQRSKNGMYTATAANTIVNTYTALTANATAGATVIAVSNATLSGAQFTGNLAPGDLIMIIQMQGATLDCDVTPTTVYGGNYTSPIGHTFDWYLFRELWGQVTAYNNAGNFEKLEVLSVSGNVITVECGLKNSYSTSGHTQVIRIPRFSNLTVNSGASIVPSAWNGTVGGVVAVEVENTLNLNNNTVPNIHANGLGFRPGLVDPTGLAGGSIGVRYLGSNLPAEGSAKGEGIGGFTTEYAAIYSTYGISAPANGGGGGGYQNCGGGGGSNVGPAASYTGKGVPTPGYTAIWNLETAGMGTSSSPGGGRGGYALSETNLDETTVGPNNTGWNGDHRQTNGGLGGHPLAYTASRIFMGGGGGAGDQDSGQGGSGGAGGGIVFITVYGSTTGTGKIQANGNVGQKSNPLNQAAGFGQKKGNDGAGGGGGGGSVYIENISNIPATYSLTCNGGAGGDHALTIGSFGGSVEGAGPGGGGSGGFIGTSASSSAVTSIIGGNNGTTNSAHIVNFPPNGATLGAVGITNQLNNLNNLIADNDTICSNGSASLAVILIGTLPVGSNIYWYTSQFSGTSVNTGLTYNTPVIATTTTYWVGICPGNFRIPVTATVSPAPVISGTAVITNATCNTSGSITGLSATGSNPLTYTWNGISFPNANLTGASPSSYTLTVTDVFGCTSTSGPYTITGAGGPVIDASGVVITNQICNGTLGSISGITASGTGLLTYSWSNTVQTTLNISSLTANSYTLTVTDGNGCTAMVGPFVVNNTAGPTIDETNALVVNENCNMSNGSITGITASGNGLTFAWTSTAQTTLDLSSISAGNYVLTVTDNNGCTATSVSYTVNNIAGPTIDATNIVVNNESCGMGNGSITGISVSGGTNPLTYSWTGTVQTTLNITSLASGNYTLTVTDFSGCTANSGPHVIGNNPGPVIDVSNISIQNESCSGNDGAISNITVVGSGLNYLWSNGDVTLDISNLTPGNYSLGVNDVNGCVANAGPFTINPAVIMTIDQTNQVVTPSACTSNTGSISGIIVNGGINPVYSWSNGASTLDINNLAPGNYTLTVTDNQGCQLMVVVAVGLNNPPVIDASNVIIAPAHCGKNDGGVSGITVNGGTPAYTYNWNTSPSNNTLDVSNETSGTYQFIVTDNQGCSDSLDVIIPEISGPTIDNSNLVAINENCNKGNGSINGLLVAGNGPFTYQWNSDTVVVLNLNNLSAGNYNFTVTDVNGCVENLNGIVIANTPGPTADFTFTPSDPMPGEMISFIDNSSSSAVNWQWNFENDTIISQNVTYSFGEGIHLVQLIVVDINGCSDTITKNVEVFENIEIPNVITANADNTNDIFYVKGLKSNSSLIILNRWGNIVLDTDDYKNNWIGIDLGGEELSAGVYEYILTEPDGTVNHGFVHLVR